jgi:central glycolytic genes regulator
MRKIIELQKQLLPDLMDVMKRRYSILRQVMASDSVGRRSLAASLYMTERVLRAETDFLKAQGLLEINAAGMRISEAGKLLVDALEPLLKDLFGLSELESKLREHFQLKAVMIVPGDSDESLQTLRELGRAGSQALKMYMNQEDVIAVTGGSTMAQLANQLATPLPMKGVFFVPARGGLGESLEYQANTIASTMAKRTGSQYRLLHVPDHLGEEAYITLMQEPNVREVVEVIRKARIVVHGIGDAMVMARRRKVDEATREAMQTDGALAEALGYYFDRTGSVIHRMSTVGLRVEDLDSADVVIGVAGGKSKGEAIAAVLRFGRDDVLVTDEAAALELLEIIKRE